MTSVFAVQHWMTSFIECMVSNDGNNHLALKLMAIKGNNGITVTYFLDFYTIKIGYGKLDDSPFHEKEFSDLQLKQASDYVENLLNNEKRKEVDTLVEDASFPKPIPKEELL